MISAVVLAAGMSRRMGEPKMTLRWSKTTVIGQVVNVLLSSGLQDIVVVTGGARQQVELALQDLPVRCQFNPSYREDEMIHSLQIGLPLLADEVQAAMIVLGDQPEIEVQVVKTIIKAFVETRAQLVVPSYQMRRGHPWLVARLLWPEIMKLSPPATLRNLVNNYTEFIHYVEIDNGTILSDIDTPEDYKRQKPR